MQDTLVIWDWDGTIIDNMQTGMSALADMAKKFGLSAPSLADAKNVMTTLKAPYWDQFGKDWEIYGRYFLERFKYHSNVHDLKIFDGVRETMAWLKIMGVRQLVISNKPDDIVQEEFKRTDLDKYLMKACGMDFHDGLHKPQKEYAQKCLNAIPYQRLIMIGDSKMDMDFADNIGAVAINVSPDARVGCGYIISSHARLLHVLKKEFAKGKI